jgi:cobalt-zinc-cadmium efflux system membrane fusion protein
MTKVRVSVPNREGRLKPGMYATITFAARPRARVVVPATSLLQVSDSDYVFVEVRPWTLERRPVIVGQVSGNRAIVREGVSSGQLVVVRQVVLLQ